MKPIFCLTLLVAGALLFTGCAAPDPLGLTTRAQLRRDAQVQVAEAQAQAQIAVAAESARAQVKTAQTWAGVLPVALLIVVAGVIGAIIVLYQGKIYLARATVSASRPPALPTEYQTRIEEYAHKTRQEFIVIDNQYYLVDQKSGKRTRLLPKQP